MHWLVRISGENARFEHLAYDYWNPDHLFDNLHVTSYNCPTTVPTGWYEIWGASHEIWNYESLSSQR